MELYKLKLKNKHSIESTLVFISHPLAEPLQPLQVGVLVKVRVHVFQETCVKGVVVVRGVSDKIKMSAY